MADQGAAPPDVDQLAAAMVLLHGDHEDHGDDGDDGDAGHRVASHTSDIDHGAGADHPPASWAKSPDFRDDPHRAAAVAAATRVDKQHYLQSGLTPVDCSFCHVSVAVRKVGPGYTAVQWTNESMQHCAVFTQLRAAGGDTARCPGCPKLSDSIRHAVAEGYLDPPPE